jgi:hypothetical protein
MSSIRHHRSIATTKEHIQTKKQTPINLHVSLLFGWQDISQSIIKAYPSLFMQLQLFFHDQAILDFFQSWFRAYLKEVDGTKTGWLIIMIMYLSRATWLPIDCCFNEWASTMKKQTSCKATSSSPPNVTCCDDNTNKQNSNIAYSMKMLESYFSYFHYVQWLCFFSLQIGCILDFKLTFLKIPIRLKKFHFFQKNSTNCLPWNVKISI